MEHNFNFKFFEALKKGGLTARDLSKITGDSESLISKFINGRRKIDEVRRIRYAKILRKKPEEIFD